ncbi:MAG TPA: hypothetical protein ENF22_09575 [Chloroflexi bacterium]|nr:hypothetical protein [Chloroflexota bacterium]
MYKSITNPVDYLVALRPTGIKRRDVRYAHDRDTETGLSPSLPQATPVFGRARSAHSVSPQGAFPVQSWCKRDGKDGIYAQCGQIVVNSIERMGGYIPHGKDGHLSRTIRSQTLYPLSCGCENWVTD